MNHRPPSPYDVGASDDRVLEPAGGDGLLRESLRPQVRVGGVRRRARHRDQDEPSDAGAFARPRAPAARSRGSRPGPRRRPAGSGPPTRWIRVKTRRRISARASASSSRPTATFAPSARAAARPPRAAAPRRAPRPCAASRGTSACPTGPDAPVTITVTTARLPGASVHATPRPPSARLVAPASVLLHSRRWSGPGRTTAT